MAHHAGDVLQLNGADLTITLHLQLGVHALKLRWSNTIHGYEPRDNALPVKITGILLKVLQGIYGDGGADAKANFFGTAGRWEVITIIPNGRCGFEARAIIQRLDRENPFEWIENFSAMIRDDYLVFEKDPSNWLDVYLLLNDVVQLEPAFASGALWLRVIATCSHKTECCSIEVRAGHVRPSNEGGFGLVPTVVSGAEMVQMLKEGLRQT